MFTDKKLRVEFERFKRSLYPSGCAIVELLPNDYDTLRFIGDIESRESYYMELLSQSGETINSDA